MLYGQRTSQLVQLKIHFEALFVRYLWLLVQHQYPPAETRPTLHNPLGLSLGLKFSLTSPQFGRKAAAIALPFWAKTDIMLQSPPRRKYTIFYEDRYVRYRQPKKCVSTHRSHTHVCSPTLPKSSTVVTLTFWGQPAVRDISTHRYILTLPLPPPARVY